MRKLREACQLLRAAARVKEKRLMVVALLVRAKLMNLLNISFDFNYDIYQFYYQFNLI